MVGIEAEMTPGGGRAAHGARDIEKPRAGTEKEVRRPKTLLHK